MNDLTVDLLNEVLEFTTKLNLSNSGNYKKEILLEYKDSDDIKKVLEYTYSPFKQYGVTSDNLIKNYDKCHILLTYDNLFDLLDALDNRTITGHTAIAEVNGFIQEYNQFTDIIHNIIDGNLKTRTDSKLVNKIMKGCIPTFEVALANKYDTKMSKRVFWEDGYFASRKIDGIRCICLIDNNGDIEIKSRNGKAFATLDKIKNEVKSIGLKNMVFDGEVCLVDENGNEQFQGIMKQIFRKDHTIENARYKIFDFIPLDDFLRQESEIIFSDRLQNLTSALSTYNGTVLSQLPQELILSDDHLIEWIDKGKESNWEGVMIRKDTGYKGKRSNDLLKIKQFQDAEYKVIDIEIGPFRVIENGLEAEIEVMTNVIIEHKNNIVSVGSGFSLDERKKFKSNPELILDKIITVQFFEESINKEGKYSLRFPTVKTIHGKKRLS